MQERGIVATLTAGRRRALLTTASIAAVVVAADQATKSWAVADLHQPVHLFGPFGLALEYNSGTAFSLLDGAGVWLVPVVLVVLGVVAWLAWHAQRALLVVCYGLLVGGAIGNLADRLFRGHHGDVVDFVTLSHWPTFNVADACITVGVVLLAIAIVVFTPKRVVGGPEDRGAQADPDAAVDPGSSRR